MIHVVYKIEKLDTNEFYIGIHSTYDINDGYMGSGLLISRYIKIYGESQFRKSILFTFDTKQKAVDKEIELVNETTLRNPLCLNIALGGCGGNLGPDVNRKIGQIMSQILKGRPKTKEHKQALIDVWSNKNYTVPDYVVEKIRNTTISNWSKLSLDERKKKFGHPKETNGFFGKKHSFESIQLMKKNLPNRKGSENPNAKSVILNGVFYKTRKECMESLGITKRKLYTILGEIQ